ncbi:hypothetical protein ACGTJS_03490 [Faucicola mancuniensis]|uniref:ACP-like domain-containing protein n=1 Tax=Faucicola mancuniensis TaxID=1309795 RepID=UPI003977D7F1
MKKFALTSLIAIATMTGAVSASAMTPKTVNYTCQGGKSLNVKYNFNSALPTKATAKLNGATRVLAYNQVHSDIAGTIFGTDKGYMISADYMDVNNYNQVSLGTVTSPSGKIIYKDCSPN